MSIRFAGAALGAVLLAVVGPAASRSAQAASPADAATLAASLPEGANAIGVLHVQRLLNSPRGREAGWDDKVRSAYIAGSTVVPKWADTLVVGAPIHPGDAGAPWVAAAFTGPDSMGVAQLAPGGRAELSELGGKPAFVSRGGAYVVELGPGRIGSYSPPRRQAASLWVRTAAETGGDGPTPFLKAAAATDAGVVLAMDTMDMFDPDAVAAFVGQVDGVDAANVDAVADLVTGARGILVSVDVGREITATLQVQFGAAVDVPADQLGIALKAALAKFGLSIPELADATFEAEGESLTAELALSNESFGLLVSLLSGVHHGAGEDMAATDPGSADSATPTETGTGNEGEVSYDPDATRRYGKAVKQAVGRLNHLNGRGTSLQTGLRFLDSNAQRLQELPVQGVAPAMVERGEAIAKGMRALSASIQGAAVEVDAAQRSFTYNVNYDPGSVGVSWWGGWAYRPPSAKVNSNLATVREEQARAVAAGASDRAQIWEYIQEDATVIDDLLKQLDNPRLR